jgi:hypothetical protein
MADGGRRIQDCILGFLTVQLVDDLTLCEAQQILLNCQTFQFGHVS